MLRVYTCITCSLSMFAYLLGHTTGTIAAPHCMIIAPAMILLGLAFTWRPNPPYIVEYHYQGFNDRPYV